MNPKLFNKLLCIFLSFAILFSYSLPPDVLAATLKDSKQNKLIPQGINFKIPSVTKDKGVSEDKRLKSVPTSGSPIEIKPKRIKIGKTSRVELKQEAEHIPTPGRVSILDNGAKYSLKDTISMRPKTIEEAKTIGWKAEFIDQPEPLTDKLKKIECKKLNKLQEDIIINYNDLRRI